MLTVNDQQREMLSTRVIWEQCCLSLREEISAQQYNTWIKPLQIGPQSGSAQSPLMPSELQLLAPNRFILEWVKSKFLQRIYELVNHYLQAQGANQRLQVVVTTVSGQQQGFQQFSERGFDSGRLEAGQPATKLASAADRMSADDNLDNNTAGLSATSQLPQSSQPMVSLDNPTMVDIGDCAGNTIESAATAAVEKNKAGAGTAMVTTRHTTTKPTHRSDNTDAKTQRRRPVHVDGALKHRSGLNPYFTFKTFVEGKSNQMGLAAAMQVAENPGGAYNPLFIYGGVGLGKTHLMHAVGNDLAQRNNNAKIVYLHSERFVADMVKALQLNAINDFKRYYRSVDALLIDDIQFFAGKDRSQEEFFHTFNALLEGNQQIILTCDRYPKVINNLEERLKSRFGWGLTVEVEPPELETRVAILIKKAEEIDIALSHETAFFIAQRIRSNVRELEGALKRVIANAKFTSRPISIDLIREALKDLLALQDKQVSIHNIQRVVGEYYKVKIGDFISKRRSRSVARPRQVAMCLAKELTNYSLPEIGDAFGGRDHTTVLHACRKIKELCETNADMEQDLKNLQRLLTT